MEWRHHKRLIWVALVLLAGFFAACSSSDSDNPGDPESPFALVADEVTYDGAKTQATITADNADILAAGALGFDALGAAPETKSLTKATSLLTGRDDESLTLAELLDSLPGASEATPATKMPSPGYFGGDYPEAYGYGGFLYKTIDLLLEEPDEVLLAVLHNDFPNLSGEASFSQSTTMVLNETARTATFTTDLTFTDCKHCLDEGFTGSEPALCDDLVALTAETAQAVTVIDLTGIDAGDLAELKAMQSEHPEIALMRLLEQEYRGDTEGDNYTLPRTCTLAYTGTVETTENEDDEETFTQTMTGTFASTFEEVMDFPLTDSGYNSDVTISTNFYSGYLWGYGGYGTGTGGYLTKRSTTFSGTLTAKQEGGPDGPLPMESLAVDLSIPNGTLTKTFESKRYANSATEAVVEDGDPIEAGQKLCLTSLAIEGNADLDLSWEQSGVAGKMAMAVDNGTLTESRDYASYTITQSDTTKHCEWADDTRAYSFGGNATLAASLTADLLSPVTQSLDMKVTDGSLEYSNARRIRLYDEVKGTSRIQTDIDSSWDMTLGGRVTLTSKDNYFLYNGTLSVSQKHGYTHTDSLTPENNFSCDEELLLAADDVTIQSNGIDVGLDGTFASHDGTWWDAAAGESGAVRGDAEKTTTELDLVLVNNLTGTSRWYNAYVLVTETPDKTPGAYPECFRHTSTTMTGRFYNSEFGYVDLATADGEPLRTFDLNDWDELGYDWQRSDYFGFPFPADGKLLFTGAADTAASLIPLAILSAETDEIKRIPVPDGFRVTFGEATTDYQWPDLEAMLAQNWVYRLTGLLEIGSLFRD